ncbi:MAG: nuclear transport factor 2 family protein [Gammaproteobacteria bacterium]|jgi:hypothetical protein|tara:strand:+ start:779 stop:1180 length:402 start_codon:yes stop_codon:yes gene_type:complete
MHATTNPIEIWHKTILDNDPSELFSILDDSFQFYSPAVFKSKEKYMGYIYLLAASQSFLTSDFKYTREIIDKEQAVLEFECTMGGVTVNGIDMFKWNSNNKLTEMKVMIRTEKALEAVKQEMTKNLSKPELWR